MANPAATTPIDTILAAIRKTLEDAVETGKLTEERIELASKRADEIAHDALVTTYWVGDEDHPEHPGHARTLRKLSGTPAI